MVCCVTVAIYIHVILLNMVIRECMCSL